MSEHYIGRSPAYGLFETQTLTPDSSTVTFALSYAVGGASSLLVNYGGVIQLPNIAYSISGGGTSITFSEAPVTGTTLIITYMGKQLTVARTAGQEVTKQAFTGDSTTTTYVLTDPPVVAAGVLVFVDGVQQREGAGNNFQSVGSNIIFSAAPALNAEIDVYVLVREKVSIDTVADGILGRVKFAPAVSRSTVGEYSIISTSTTATAGSYYFVDTTSAAITVTLPVTALLGDTVRIIDLSGTFDTNNCTIARNSHKIQRATEDLTVNTEGSAFDLVYSNSTNGWLVVPL